MICQIWYGTGFNFKSMIVFRCNVVWPWLGLSIARTGGFMNFYRQSEFLSTCFEIRSTVQKPTNIPCRALHVDHQSSSQTRYHCSGQFPSWISIDSPNFYRHHNIIRHSEFRSTTNIGNLPAHTNTAYNVKIITDRKQAVWRVHLLIKPLTGSQCLCLEFLSTNPYFSHKNNICR